MSVQTICGKCGKPLEAEALACGACGAVSGAFPGASMKIPNVTLPLNLGTSLGSTSFAPVSDVGRIDAKDLKLSFGADGAAQGRPYKPVFAVGRRAGEGEELRKPFALAALASGELLILHFLDEGGSEIWRCAADGRRSAVIGPFPPGSGEGALDTPAALGVDGSGNIHVLDMAAGQVKKFSPDGRLLACLGSAGVGPEQLTTPQGLAIGSDGSLYLGDTGNSRVLKWDAQGRFQLAIGIDELDEDTGAMRSGSEPGELDEPQGLCIDGGGNICVADSNNHRIQVFSPSGALLRAFGEEGMEPGRLYYPRVVRVNDQGDVYVADSKPGRVQKFNPEGQFIYQVVAPADAGLVDDFVVDPSGRLVLALRNADLVLGIEIE